MLICILVLLQSATFFLVNIMLVVFKTCQKICNIKIYIIYNMYINFYTHLFIICYVLLQYCCMCLIVLCDAHVTIKVIC